MLEWAENAAFWIPPPLPPNLALGKLRLEVPVLAQETVVVVAGALKLGLQLHFDGDLRNTGQQP